VLAIRGALIYWREGLQEHLVFVDVDGNARKIDASPSDAARVAADLCAGRSGEFVQAESNSRTWTWVAGGIGVAAIVSGIILGQSASSDFDTLNSRYPTGMVDAAGADLRDSGQTKQTAANVLIGVGAASAVAAVFLYWYEGRSPESARAQLSPLLDRGFAGAQLRVGF
jgi:hypothetical protein